MHALHVALQQSPTLEHVAAGAAHVERSQAAMQSSPPAAIIVIVIIIIVIVFLDNIS